MNGLWSFCCIVPSRLPQDTAGARCSRAAAQDAAGAVVAEGRRSSFQHSARAPSADAQPAKSAAAPAAPSSTQQHERCSPTPSGTFSQHVGTNSCRVQPACARKQLPALQFPSEGLTSSSAQADAVNESLESVSRAALTVPAGDLPLGSRTTGRTTAAISVGTAAPSFCQPWRNPKRQSPEDLSVAMQGLDQLMEDIRFRAEDEPLLAPCASHIPSPAARAAAAAAVIAQQRAMASSPSSNRPSKAESTAPKMASPQPDKPVRSRSRSTGGWEATWRGCRPATAAAAMAGRPHLLDSMGRLAATAASGSAIEASAAAAAATATAGGKLSPFQSLLLLPRDGIVVKSAAAPCSAAATPAAGSRGPSILGSLMRSPASAERVGSAGRVPECGLEGRGLLQSLLTRDASRGESRADSGGGGAGAVHVLCTPPGAGKPGCRADKEAAAASAASAARGRGRSSGGCSGNVRGAGGGSQEAPETAVPVSCGGGVAAAREASVGELWASVWGEEEEEEEGEEEGVQPVPDDEFALLSPCTAVATAAADAADEQEGPTISILRRSSSVPTYSTSAKQGACAGGSGRGDSAAKGAALGPISACSSSARRPAGQSPPGQSAPPLPRPFLPPEPPGLRSTSQLVWSTGAPQQAPHGGLTQPEQNVTSLQLLAHVKGSRTLTWRAQRVVHVPAGGRPVRIFGRAAHGAKAGVGGGSGGAGGGGGGGGAGGSGSGGGGGDRVFGRSESQRAGQLAQAAVQLLPMLPEPSPYDEALPYPEPSVDALSYGAGARQRQLPYASKQMSQMVLLPFMQHSGSVVIQGTSSTPPSLNLGALSREISALRWIGQGGGGAVFQGVWQGIPVAVKFLLTDVDGTFDEAALEGVVSTVVNHPNVLHTYAFECARLTEASFHESEFTGGCEEGGTELLESLMESCTTFSDSIGLVRRGKLLQPQGTSALAAMAAAAAPPSLTNGGVAALCTNTQRLSRLGLPSVSDIPQLPAGAVAVAPPHSNEWFSTGVSAAAPAGGGAAAAGRTGSSYGTVVHAAAAGGTGSSYGTVLHAAVGTAAHASLGAMRCSSGAGMTGGRPGTSVSKSWFGEVARSGHSPCHLLSPPLSPPSRRMLQSPAAGSAMVVVSHEVADAGATAFDRARRLHSLAGNSTGGAMAGWTHPAKAPSGFQSEDGFGDLEAGLGAQFWSVRQVLSYLKARPGMYMTHIIMEHCEHGSLLSAITRGVFRLPDDEGGSSGGGGGRGVGAGGGGGRRNLGSTQGNTQGSTQRSAQGGALATLSPLATAISSNGGMLASPLVSAFAGAGPGVPVFLLHAASRRVVLRALLRTARDVAQGMSHLHANGIIHGDLKPANVLLRSCRTGFKAVVSDFGLSKLTRGDKPLELNHWSTVTVMAPEVIMGRWLKASDVFSFGILLWQLLTGDIMPYGTCTVPQILVGVSQGMLKPEWPASAHPALVRLGRACLATSPEKRPSFEAIVKMLTKIEKVVGKQQLVRAPNGSGGAPRSASQHSGGATGAAAKGPHNGGGACCKHTGTGGIEGAHSKGDCRGGTGGGGGGGGGGGVLGGGGNACLVDCDLGGRAGVGHQPISMRFP